MSRACDGAEIALRVKVVGEFSNGAEEEDAESGKEDAAESSKEGEAADETTWEELETPA